MKKIAAVVFFIAIAGFSLHAQLVPGIGIGAWARYVVAPIGGAGTFGENFSFWDDMYARNQSNQNWLFPTRGKVGLATWGNSDFVGFNFDFAYEDGSLRVGDQAKIWVRPHEAVMLHFGRIEGNRLRSGIRGGRLTYTEEENEIFTRFLVGSGMLVEFDPIENLFVGFSLDLPRAAGVPHTFREMFHWDTPENSYQIGIGYRFNFGHLRAQFLGNGGGIWTGKPIQVAFAYTGIHNLVLEVGGLYPLRPLDFSPARATVAAEHSSGRWNMMGRATVVWWPETLNAGTRLKLGSVIQYTVNFPLFLGVEIAYLSDHQGYVQQRDHLPPVANGLDLFQICPFVGFRFGRGELRFGFHWEQNFRGDRTNFRFEFPIMLEVSFF